MTTPSSSTVLKKQSGIVLLEGLIAILIFSFGILALVGMQTMAVRQVTDARYRSDAGLLTSQLFGTMWASDRTAANLKANFETNKPGYNTWFQTVSNTLPGVSAGSNKPTVEVSDAGIVKVTVRWKAPNESANELAHEYVAVTQIQ